MSAPENHAASREPLRLPPWVWCVAWALMLLGFLSAAYFGYDILAKKAFTEHVAELEAMGETLDYEKLIPDSVPQPGDNFAEAPIIRHFRDGGSESGGGEEPAWLDLGEPSREAIAGMDITARQSKSVRHLTSRPIMDEFPGLTPEEAYRNTNDYIAPFASVIDALGEAARRPESFARIDFEKGFAAGNGSVGSLFDYTRLIRIRSQLALATGDVEQAFSDTALILRLAPHLSSHSLLISQLVANAYAGMGLSTCGTGLRQDAWTGEQLQAFAEILSSYRVEEDYLHSIRLERALFCHTVNEWSMRGSSVKSLLSAPVDEISFLIPQGWLYTNSRKYSEIIQENVLTHTDGRLAHERLPHPDRVERVIEDLRDSPVDSVHLCLTLAAFPTFDSISERILRTSVQVDHMRIAIALEQHRRRRGAFPDTLDAIADSFPGDLPLDPCTEAPYRYRLLADGTYLLYGVGTNRIDESGLLKYAFDQGDWVWRLNLPADFDYDDYRRSE